ncbi:reticulon-3 isoform X1 [Pteronotus mesoamericanus]|uniref:reticulon-3 isoform X1 n=1 Tax=Pteronotus mesoamericanus TaxID=1884717 RepID=UPI0023EBED2A|nr:reticulon-3 isoform X1 [Pteronotus parnellii mesoamericanus]
MAELSAATQSPSVSSSSSGAEPSAPGSGSPGACPALGAKSCGSSCADSFVSSSSSQPVSLFSTSQEGLSSLCSDEPPSEILTSSYFSTSEIHKTDLAVLHGEQSKVLGSQPILAKEGKDCLALLDVKKMEKPQGTSKDGANSPVSVAEGGRCSRPSIPASFPDHPAFLSKEVVRSEKQINKDQESKNPNEIPSRNDNSVLDADDKLTLLTAQKPPTEQPKAEGTCTYSLSPSKVSGGGIIEKDSPESPFEVIIDKAAFDKEYKDAYKESANDFGSWAMHTDRESSADISESNDKVFPLRNKETGRFPTSALLTRQFSHTTAALEEVSRCVNDMHNFTNEILTWDLVPQVKQQNDQADYITKTVGFDMSEYNSEIPVVNLKTNTHQKIPVCSINGSTPITKSTGNWAEASLPQENAVIEKPIPDSLDSTTDISIKGVRGNVQKQGDTLSELPGSPFEKCISVGSGMATVKVFLPDGHQKGEMTWQNAMLGEVTEADSSGESDDTVIEDITASISFESNRIQAEKPVSIPSVVVKADEKEIKEILNYSRETKTSENFERSVSDSQPQVKPDIVARSPAGMAAGSPVPDMNVMSENVKQSDRMSDIIPEKAVTTEDPKLPSAASSNVNETEFSLNVTASAHLESLDEKSIKDIDDSSPEDLMAAFTETREKGMVNKGKGNAFEATSEKTVDFKTTLPIEVLYESGSSGSEVKDMKSKYSHQSKEISGSEPLDAFPAQCTSVASLDLEQEQLTIRALKELSERQAEKSASARDKVEPRSEETLKQIFTFAPESSQPQRSHDVLEHTDVQGSDFGISKKPTIIKETSSVDVTSSLSKTELVNKHVLARLLADFSVHDLIFWRDVKKTGFVFGTTLIVLLSLAAFSVISVVSYLILALLSVTISFRVYKSVIQAVQKSEEGHPFKAYLDVDITLSSEAFHNYVNAALVHVNKALKLIIRLFLVEDLVDSLKLAVFMWLMTYVGAVFNGITLLILAELLVFSVPIVYEKYKTQIDHYVGIARDQTKSIVEKIQAKLPGIAKKKAE